MDLPQTLTCLRHKNIQAFSIRAFIFNNERSAPLWHSVQLIFPQVLDAEADGELIVCDSGPGIKPRDTESIFELCFSRKPGGRGMGLYISREVMRKIDYDLACIPTEHGAEFHIIPHKNIKENVQK